MRGEREEVCDSCVADCWPDVCVPEQGDQPQKLSLSPFQTLTPVDEAADGTG